MKGLETEELIPLLADLKKTVGYLIEGAQQDRRTIEGMFTTLRIHSENIGLLHKGYLELLEADSGRNSYLSSKINEIRAKDKVERDDYL